VLVARISDPDLPLMVIEVLETGGVLIFPTDTVYGIGGNPWDERALERVRMLKDRDRRQPFSLHLASVETIDRFASINADMRSELVRFLPGPITFLLPANESAPPSAVMDGKVSVRVPAHPFFASIMHQLDRPLFGTSVNRSGAPPLIAVDQMIEQFSGVDLLVEGVVDGASASAIIDITVDPPVVLRGDLPPGFGSL